MPEAELPSPGLVHEANRLENLEVNKDLRDQEAAVSFFSRHAKEIREKKFFSALALETLPMLDENLELNYQTKIDILGIYVRMVCNQVGVDPNSFGVETAKKLSELFLKYYGKEDPRYQWLQELSEMSSEKYGDRLAGLTGTGGVWGLRIEPDNRTSTGGVSEMKKGVAQTLIEIARNQAERATQTIPFMAGPPDATSREAQRVDGERFSTRAHNGECDWQKGDLENVRESKTVGALNYDAMFHFDGGTPLYREYGASIEEMPIRVFREIVRPDGHKVAQFVDVPANKFLCAHESEINGAIRGNWPVVFGNAKWQELPELPELSGEAPAISVSIGGSANPDSALFRHARSGKSMIHLHYDLSRDVMDLMFSHVSFDGVAGLDWTLAVAETVGAKNKDVERGLVVDWYPPTQILEKIRPEQVKSLFQYVKEQTLKGKTDYLNNPKVMEMMYILNLSDIAISEELSAETYKNIASACDAINNEWYTPAVKKLEEMIEADRDAGRSDITENAKRMIINRLAATKMTPTKFIDFMARQFYGPEAGCMIPRDPGARLIMVSFTEFSNEVAEEIKTFGYRKSEKGDQNVFSLKTMTSKLKGEWKRAYRNACESFAVAWLQNITEITAIKRFTKDYRMRAEIATEILSSKLHAAMQIAIQTSHLGSVVRYASNSKEVVARAVGFTSGQTTPQEDKFRGGLATIEKTRDGKKTLRFTDRVRLTTRELNELRMSNQQLMYEMAQKLVNKIAIDTEDRERKLALAAKAAGICEMVRDSLQKEGVIDPGVSDYNVPNLLVTLGAIETISRIEDVEEREMAMVGMDLLTAAALIERDERFFDTCNHAAVESSEAIKGNVPMLYI